MIYILFLRTFHAVHLPPGVITTYVSFVKPYYRVRTYYITLEP